MFKLKNTAQENIFFGIVSNLTDKDFTLTGTEWNRETREEIKETNDFVFGEEKPSIKDGWRILVKTAKDSNIVTAIASLGEAISFKDDKGNDSVAFQGKVVKKDWNDKHNKLDISFNNLKADGQRIGRKSDWKTRDGKERTTYWYTVAIFNNKYGDYAESADSRIEVGDNVLMRSRTDTHEYNGKMYENHYGILLERTYRPAKKDNTVPEAEADEMFQTMSDEEFEDLPFA